MSNIYLGVISGTSMDGLDVAAVSFTKIPPFIKLHATYTYAFPADLLEKLRTLAADPTQPYHDLLVADRLLGEYTAQILNAFCTQHGLKASDIVAIGAHGQTIQHRPPIYSCQITNHALVAELTGLPVISDFRNSDIAAGGQGAPLVCGFHQWLASCYQKSFVFLNIGGISNITYATPELENTLGYDIGPGNCLLDAHAKQQINKPFDENGAWARQGKINNELLDLLLYDPYFKTKPPKSTGVEYFNLNWLAKTQNKLGATITPEDLQATLMELTVLTIGHAIDGASDSKKPVYIFGGGARNTYLMERLSMRYAIHSTQELQILPDYLEATAFAWLAWRRIEQQPGNVPQVTGARGVRILGAINSQQKV